MAEGSDAENYAIFAKVLDDAARNVGVNFIGGFSALVHKGYTKGDKLLIKAIPEALSTTERVCSSVNVATTQVHHYGCVKEMGLL